MDTQEQIENDAGRSILLDDVRDACYAVYRAARDAFDSVLVHLDADTCEKLDACVAAGVVASRREAAEFFLLAGLQAREDIFERVSQTNAQVDLLRQQMRTLKGVGIIE
jgi:hypothetical protein